VDQAWSPLRRCDVIGSPGPDSPDSPGHRRVTRLLPAGWRLLPDSRRVPRPRLRGLEAIASNDARSAQAAATKDIPVAAPADIEWANAVVLDTPTPGYTDR
jgi:hypothetical protein